MSKTCIYCGAKATVWCDYVLGHDDDGSGALPGWDTPLHRCDAGLCADHSVEVMRIHLSGASSVAGVLTVDHCIGHGIDEDIGGSRRGFLRRPITGDEAKRLRYRHRCQAGAGLGLASSQAAVQLSLLGV